MCDVGEVLRSDVTLLGLWKHECERVFCDRLIDEADKGWFAKTVDKVLDDRYGGAKSAALKEPMHFVDFLRDGEENEETGEEGPPPQIYEPVADLPRVRERLGGYMERFNENNKLHAVDLVLFDDALLHFIRISRILKIPRGCALLLSLIHI